MDDPGSEKDKELMLATADPAAEVDNTNDAEPLDDDGKDKEGIEVATERHPSSSSHGRPVEVQEKRPGLEHTKSYATTASAMTRTESHLEEIKKKPWYKKVNPLRWGKVPPVPETRTVSREYNAPFLSLIYFQWMAPMMSARLAPHLHLMLLLLTRARSDTNGPSNRMIFGP
jgi:ATP-binding cassette subfamily C (CFTR/MRP) protein 1